MNSKVLSTILTVAACGGVIATGYLASRNTAKSLEYLKDAEGELTTKDKVKLTWKNYIPSATAATLTMGTIIFCQAHHIKTEKTLIAAAAGAQTFLNAYERKVNERIDTDTAINIRKEVIGEIEAGLCEDVHQSFSSDGSKMLCYCPYTEKFFRASQTELLIAETKVNGCLMNGGGMSLKTYMSLFGVDYEEPDDDNFGWYMDDSYEWNSSFYGYYNAMTPYIRNIKGREALVIFWSHDPLPIDEGFFVYSQC